MRWERRFITLRPPVSTHVRGRADGTGFFFLAMRGRKGLGEGDRDPLPSSPRKHRNQPRKVCDWTLIPVEGRV